MTVFQGRVEVVKEAVRDTFGEPKVSGSRKYYNIKDVLDIVDKDVAETPAVPYDLTARNYTDDYNDDLPY